MFLLLHAALCPASRHSLCRVNDRLIFALVRLFCLRGGSLDEFYDLVWKKVFFRRNNSRNRRAVFLLIDAA